MSHKSRDPPTAPAAASAARRPPSAAEAVAVTHPLSSSYPGWLCAGDAARAPPSAAEAVAATHQPRPVAVPRRHPSARVRAWMCTVPMSQPVPSPRLMRHPPPVGTRPTNDRIPPWMITSPDVGTFRYK